MPTDTGAGLPPSTRVPDVTGPLPAHPRPLEAVAAAILEERVCARHGSDCRPVVGTGDADADLLLLGDVPSRHDVLSERPFTGGVGNVLDHALARGGLRRDDCYLTTVVKCVAGPADLRPDVVDPELPLLREQIAAVCPRVIVTLGAETARVLLGHPVPLQRLDGFRADVFDGVTLVPTVHPRESIHGNPSAVARIGRDLGLARAVLEGRAPTGAETVARLRARRIAGT